MDRKQLELDLRPKEEKRERTATILDLRKARRSRQQKDTEELFRAIISSVEHISTPEKKFK